MELTAAQAAAGLSQKDAKMHNRYPATPAAAWLYIPSQDERVTNRSRFPSVQCFGCDEHGHVKYNCPDRPPRRQ